MKELFPVMVAAALYGPQWRGKIVQFVVDNLAVVQVLNSTYSSNNHLINASDTLNSIPGITSQLLVLFHTRKNNSLADALLQNNLHFFHSQIPRVSPNQSKMPTTLISLLSQNLTWTSADWTKHFNVIIQQPWLHLQRKFTRRQNSI